jgi:hypothetical protein
MRAAHGGGGALWRASLRLREQSHTASSETLLAELYSSSAARFSGALPDRTPRLVLTVPAMAAGMRWTAGLPAFTTPVVSMCVSLSFTRV